VSPALNERLAALELVGFDIDGVFTDGRFYLSDDGSESKAFHTQDGFGIRRLIDAGVAVAVISGRASGAVEIRMRELGVRHVLLRCRDKLAAFRDLLAELDIDASHAAFVGDDVPDLKLLGAAGVAIGVANAHAEIRKDCDWITASAGGSGAVREVCDAVLAAREQAAADPV